MVLLQIWFGISDYTQNGTNLEQRMRSHPLVATVGKEDLPQAQMDPESLQMLNFGPEYDAMLSAARMAVFTAADWR